MITKDIQEYLGLILIAVGIVAGIYFGVYLCFVKGSLEFFQGLNPVNVTHLAWGIIRVALSGLVGWITFGICSVIGVLLIYFISNRCGGKCRYSTINGH